MDTDDPGVTSGVGVAWSVDDGAAVTLGLADAEGQAEALGENVGEDGLAVADGHTPSRTGSAIAMVA